MDKIPESDQNGEIFVKNKSQGQTAEVCNEDKNLPKNRLLYSFVQHVWDPRHGPCYDGQEYQKLENWLKTIEYEWSDGKKHTIFRNSEGSPFCTSRKPISTISYEDFQHKKQESRDMIILAHVAYQLRSLIKFLNTGKADVNYKNCDHRVVLDAYLHDCRDLPADAPEDQISICRKVSALEKFLEAGAHVNVQDHEGRLPIYEVWEGNNPENLKLLLDFGADVNNDDISKLIVSKRCKSRDVVVSHAIKRKLVGLPIAKVYEPLTNDPEYEDSFEKCSKEAIKLKNHRDDDGFSLYEFLKMDPKFQYHCIDKISPDFKNLEELFPMYAGLIRGACRESAVRRQLLEPARIVWAENSGVHLPEVCVERILSYLSNRYLKIMITTSKEIKAKSVPHEKVNFKYKLANGNWAPLCYVFS